MKLRPADIRIKWDWMRPKIEEMFKGIRDRPEEIYASCRFGSAALYVSDDAFIVLEPQTNQATGELEAFIRAAWCVSGDAFGAYMEQVIEIAKSGGAVRLVGSTPHESLGAHYEKQGFRRVHTVYEWSI